jgi:HlyD family secretion protein
MKSLVYVLAFLLSILSACFDGSSDAIEASGTIEGTDVRVGSEVSGKIKVVRIDEGASVRKGDTLVIVDDTDYQLQLQQAHANAEAFDAQYRLALEGNRKEDILQAEAAFKIAEADYIRLKDLLTTQTVTQKQYDDAYNRFIAAQQTYEKLTKGLRREEVIVARAMRDQATAQVDQLRKKIRDCNILAPSEGTVTLKSVEEGELLAVGNNVARITQLDPVKLTIYVAEPDLARIRIGQAAEIRIDGTEQSFEGSVVYISSVAEFTPKNVQTQDERTNLVFAVKILIPNSAHLLKPGMPADARLLPAKE